jgi:short-subunit dehydrogenase
MQDHKKYIIITGASKWIGKHIFEALKTGFTVEGISRTLWWNSANDMILWDLSCNKDTKKICKIICEKKVPIDVLILNAWVGEFWKFEEISLKKSENIIQLNLLANIRILYYCKEFITKKTQIIFIGSIISKKFMKWASVYQASKFGVRWLAWWLKSEGKKVHIINPKIVNTDFHKNKVELNNYFQETKIEDITSVVQNIIDKKEQRFEIDL